MRLLNSDLEEICKSYDLGSVKSVKLMKEGVGNYNFDVKTTKGDYIIRIIMVELSDWKKEQLKKEFEVLQYLKIKKFPYIIPEPVLNSKGEIMSCINKHNIWVYPKIKGTCNNKSNRIKLEEIGRAIAVYHNFIKDYNIKKKNELYDLEWVYDSYNEYKKIRVKNELDRLIAQNVSLFEKALGIAKEREFNEKLTLVHADFQFGNVLFKKNKLIGVIDFENVRVAPRIFDLSQAVKYTCIKNYKVNENDKAALIKGYEKINPLTKSEKGVITNLMLLSSCCEFAWFYKYMKRSDKVKIKFIKQEVKIVKNMI
ncbi:MAG: phosphotransferase [Nanoarchaeota archaeon]|nr:phosphotransferase [Nanoarchaeota archaeon]